MSAFIQPHYLWVAITVFCILILLLTGAIFLYLYRKKSIFFANAYIQKQFEEWISACILDDTVAVNQSIVVPLFLQQQLKNVRKKQFALNLLLQNKRQLMGFAAQKIIFLYEELGFKQYSIQKLKSHTWHIKARGIQELYLMEQHDMLNQIYIYTNNKNEHIRTEAQIAIVRLLGFAGLRFLDILSHPLNEWGQINLLEQLKQFSLTPMPHLSKWLCSNNYTIVLFALKLVAVYQQFQTHDVVVNCLHHKHEKIRTQAIKTLARIANEHTATILITHYANEKFTNKKMILEQLSTMTVNAKALFFLACLHEENNVLKLMAAQALNQCSQGGINVLQEKAVQYPKDYEPIYLHVKSGIGV